MILLYLSTNFSGTGDQVCTTWPEIQELLSGNPKVFIILIAAGKSGYDRIINETQITPISNILLLDKDNIFSPNCLHFTINEQKTLLRYCKKANRTRPKGYGDCGFVIVFAHTCPIDSYQYLMLIANHGKAFLEDMINKHMIR